MLQACSQVPEVYPEIIAGAKLELLLSRIFFDTWALNA
jgi:hypothetical protein